MRRIALAGHWCEKRIAPVGNESVEQRHNQWNDPNEKTRDAPLPELNEQYYYSDTDATQANAHESLGVFHNMIGRTRFAAEMKQRRDDQQREERVQREPQGDASRRHDEDESKSDGELILCAKQYV